MKKIFLCCLVFLSIANITHASSKELTLTISHEITDEGLVIVKGKTNLPEGVKLGIGLKQKEQKDTLNAYSAWSSNIFTKEDGSFESKAFSKNKEPLFNGKYVIETSLYKSGQESEELTKKLESYTGYGIESDNFEYQSEFEITTGKEPEKISEDKIQQVKTFCIVSQAASFCDSLNMRFDTYEKVVAEVGKEFRGMDSDFGSTCFDAIGEVPTQPSASYCSQIWKKYGCNGSETPKLVQQNPFKVNNPQLCEY